MSFEEALKLNQSVFEIDLASETLSGLSAYYSVLTRWNARLHLVAPCSPEEFATRHVLESLMLLKHLPQDAKIADIGSGAGLPIIPCLIARPDLHATLIESSQKKSVFLREALSAVGRHATIIARPFEEVPTPDVSFITCRALDQFIEKIPDIIRWAPPESSLLLFGGETLREKLSKETQEYKIPLSERRFLFVTTAKRKNTD
ncbi:MAG TPA: 16S rRNA (guanine(527)-N(7))-methyltransferase RsmG [Pyrinomonadaceae bacterium]|nr:16S rRNA (guanine(527)-N(7))-methyltransferase RsmG [Pyrinomonadaceae bacterium]